MKTIYHIWIIAVVVLLNSVICITACKANKLKAFDSPIELVRGSESVKAYQIDGHIVFESNRYWILTKELEDEVGSDIFIKKRKPNDKMPEISEFIKNSSFAHRNVISEYFFGIYQGFLLLDSGTDTDPRGLLIYDIEKKKKVYDTQYSLPILIASGGKLSFWVEQTEATTQNCPQLVTWQKEGLGAAIEKKIIVDLRTLIIETTSYSRCASRQ